MESLYRFLLRYHVILIFLLLEGISFVLIYNSSNYQQSSMMVRADAVKSYVYSWTSGWTGYFGLKKENKQLAIEVSYLRNQLSEYKSMYLPDSSLVAVRDTLGKKLYTYILGEVINNTTNHQNNNFIVNIGANSGVKPGMAVISDEGAVGIVRRVSNNFSTVMSVLNTDCKINSKLKRTGYFGPLVWDGENIREAVLIEVPQHASVQVGDTVVTSGYSALFPEGVMVGTVESFKITKGNFYEIRVLLSADFSKLRYVDIVTSTQRDELEEHE